MVYNIILFLILLLFFIFGVSWFVASRICRSPREYKREEWKKYDLHPEIVDFNSPDGLKLAGAFIRGVNKAIIILLHGYGRSMEQLLPQASFLNKAGYNIFMFDFRASGGSEGKFITFGQREQADLVGAIDYLKKRRDVDLGRTGLLGFSMGGAVAMMKSGDIPEVKAIVINSTYAHFKSVIWMNFQRYLKGLPFFPIGYLILGIIKFRTGIYYPRINPIKYLSRLKARPLMIIHGAHDKRVPIENALEFAKAAPWVKEFWLQRESEHENTYTISKGEYEDKVLNFFNKYLLEL
ncbi:MAG: alpha/beta fold hydrolase [Patescibacteria group bacterium]|jgi:hypothetical protein